MQNITSHFTKRSNVDLQADANDQLVTACGHMEEFLKGKAVAADVYVMDREDNYPLIVLTPHANSSIADIRNALDNHDFGYSEMRGLRFKEILVNLEKGGNEHWGVALHASQYIVKDIAESLVKNISNPETAQPVPACAYQ